MLKPYHLLFAATAASAQLLFGDQNKEYTGEGKYVTIYNENSGYKGKNYGASMLDSVSPLNRNHCIFEALAD